MSRNGFGRVQVGPNTSTIAVGLTNKPGCTAIFDKNGLRFTGSVFNDLGVDHDISA